MSLEDKIDKLCAVIEANTAAQMEVIGLAKDASGSSGDAKPKRAATGKKADEGKADTKSDSKATTVPAALKTALGEWLGEFAKDEDKDAPDDAHPEVKARKALLKKTFETLGVSKLGEINTEDQVARLTAWVEKVKAKGRLVPDPEPEGDDDDGLGV